MNRLNKILLLAFVVQLALTAVIFGTRTSGAPARPRPLLEAFDAAAVERLVLYPSLDPTTSAATGAAPDQPIELRKRGEGWVVASTFDYPAKAEPITELLGKLSGLTRTAPIASSAARHTQLDVADTAYSRKLTFTRGGEDTTLYLGRSVGSRQIAVRLGNSDAVYAISGLTSWGIDAQLRAWVDPAYASVAKDQISQVLVQRGDDSLQLLRQGGAWQLARDGAALPLPAGRTLDAALIEEVLTQLGRVELAAVADPAQPPGPTLATVSVWTQPPVDASAGSPAATAPAATAPTPADPGSAAAAPQVSSAPALVLTVAAAPGHSGQLWVQHRGAERAVLVDEGRLRKAVELSREQLLQPASGAATATPPAPPAP